MSDLSTFEVDPVEDAEAQAFEEAAVEEVTAALALAVASVIAGIVAAQVVTATAAAVEMLRRAVVARLTAIRPNVSPSLARVAEETMAAGGALLVADEQLRASIATVDVRVWERLDQAAMLAGVAYDPDDWTAVIGAAQQAVNTARANTSWVVNRSFAAGTAEVARRNGHGLLWLAERDACLHCLAYAGQVAPPGGIFPPALTYADRPLSLSLAGYPYPPAHPWCRCRVKAYDGPPPRVGTGMTNVTPADAAAREARRSVALGWSDHASLPARLRAADRLLAQGGALPPTVLRRAARAVSAGRFPTTRKRPQ